jgi:thioredoxin
VNRPKKSEPNPATAVVTRDEVDQMSGPVVLEFGASWCGYCSITRPTVAELRAKYPAIHYIWIEDGPGLPLGRSFRVKLWPTFVFLRDGKLVHRAVRPDEEQLVESFAKLALNPEK